MRRLFLGLLALGLAACVQPPPPGADPVGLVEAIYAPYRKAEAGASPTAALPYTRDLAARIEAERAAVAGGAKAAIDFDPVVAGDAYSLRGLDVALAAAPAGDTAVVVASFRTFNLPRSVRYDLRREDGLWRVDNISGAEGEGWNLRVLLDQAAATRAGRTVPEAQR
ncbi:MAG: hypothetical protein NW200_04315 [Hyphomonadaceae bacterium]|nr:hypothetical protein [Hyphomonadaceae bacterium]